MARPTKRTAATRAMVQERERKKRQRTLEPQEERGWESSDEEEDVEASGLQDPNANVLSNDSTDFGGSENSDSESEEEVLVSEGEETEELDESAFRILMARAEEAAGYYSSELGLLSGSNVLFYSIL
jgi:hypothetical protein